ncbi:serine/threonine protein phosphatase [Lactococcus cremoris]|uniref:DUF7013 family protein n=1 Tax=Lactococcus lactis subsp. cremoris TaxID=1359 RepID=UPI0011092488|nr:serine/threonine protein phosphatase [Lactococcus cremoris]TLQ11753.1 serine/threonine protein phosphatase [Lactococcus cremoris]
MQLNIHDSTLKRVGFINNNLPDALHYFDDNWHRYLAEGTSTFDFSVNKINSSYALLTLQSYISFTYDGEDYLFNIINIEQDHYSMHLQCENLNLELISEEVGAYGNTKRHSIVWYLKNVAKITNDFVEIGNNPFPLNDEDSSNPILSFDSTDTKLARIISICNSFNAEFQFRTQLKNDGTLQNITIDLYKEEGVGQKRKDVTLYYGKNIAGITSKADRTSTFFNATTVTDSKNKFNWLSVEGKHYNSDGQLEFYKNAGDNTAYAPLSRDMFPSQLKSSSSDRYTRKNLSIEATSANSLWDYAVSQFKLYAYPQMTYEVSVAVNAVTSALGNDRKLDIGDTIIVQDKTFDKSDGGLILSARVSEQEISFTNPHNNKITFTNFVRLKSEISADLYGRMKDLVDQNTPYKAEVETTNGLQFKNGKGSTTLTARIYFGSDSTETKADSYEWRKDGTLVANVQEITVDASEIDGKAVYAYKATVNEKVVGTASVTITNVNDGATGIPGQAGADGKTSYLHIAYATNSTGTAGFDVSNATGKTYIGQYTDFTSADSTDPSKYTWSLIKGDKGDTGNDGRVGKDGVGINSTTITYAISSSGTVTPTTGWTSQVPTLVKGQYLWTKTVWNYSDTTSETGYTVSYIAKDGNNGNDGIAGKDGVGITATTITYAISTSGTIAPASGWTSTVPTVAAGSYLWTKTVWTYSDSTSETGYSVAMMGAKGDQGIPGPKGADGKTQYTHIAYANSADGKTEFSTSDSNRTYIGMYVDFNVNDSTTPSDYSWTLVKGADGTQGTPGKAGADGKTPYFHTAWSYSADGTDGFTTVYPNLNLLKGTRTLTATSTASWWGTLFSSEQIYDSAIKSKTGVSAMTFSFDVHVPLNATIGGAISLQLKGQTYQANGNVGTNDFNTIVGQFWHDIEQSNLGKTIRLSFPIQIDTKYKSFDSALADTDTINIRQMNDTSGLVYSNIKLEIGSTATPHMPSESEVTTADWPSYIGQYTDFTQADSTNPSDYTWSLIRGNDGKDGATGKDGAAGKDGVGIKKTVITYAISSSGTVTPTTGWTSQVPTLVKEQYLWTKTLWTYTDNTSETGYSVSYIAKDGNNGHDGFPGKDGTGIKTTTITYAGSTSGTIAPNTGWTSTVPTVAEGSYLWTKTVWTYTDNSFETGYSVGKMGNTGPAGSTGNPGKIVSDTEPTTKFKGLTWKYSGVVDMTLGNGTKILAGTEYYWDGTVWALYEINAHNINGDNLSVTNGTFKDGKIESIWGSNGVNGTTTIEGSHLQIHSSDSTTNTENTLAIDNRQGYAQVYTERNTGRAITVQASFQGFFVSDSTGPFVRVTPNGIKTSSDKSYNSFQIGAGITINLERRGDIVEATLSGSINYPLTSNTKFSVGLIPVGYRPNRTAYIMVHMTGSINSSHIDVEPNGVCTWWGTSTNTGAPRGCQMWFTDDPLLN